MANDPRTIKATLMIDSTSFELEDIDYSNGPLSISSESFSYSSETGIFSSDSVITYAISNEDRDYPITASFSLTGALPEGENLLEALLSVRESDSSADLILHYLDFDNRIRTGERDAHIEYSNGRMELTGSLADGYIDIPGNDFSVHADIAPAAVFTVSGNLGEDAAISADIDSFEVSIANLFMIEPTVIFYEPAPVRGYIDAV